MEKNAHTRQHTRPTGHEKPRSSSATQVRGKKGASHGKPDASPGTAPRARTVPKKQTAAAETAPDVAAEDALAVIRNASTEAAPEETSESSPVAAPVQGRPAANLNRLTEKRFSTGVGYYGAALLLIGITIGFLLGNGTFSRKEASEIADDPDDAPRCEARYLLNGTEVGSERVLPGETLSGIGYPEQDGQAVIGWIDVNGNEVDPEGLIAYTDMCFTGVSGWAMQHEGGYFPGISGVFLPEAPITRLQAAELLYSLMKQPPAGIGVISDLEADSDGYEAVCCLVGEGLMDAPGGCFDPQGTMSADSFAALLCGFFRASDVEAAVGSIRYTGGDALTRAQVAVVLNRLLGIADGEAEMLDVSRDYWAYGAIAAAQRDAVLAQPLSPGFHNIDGWLYYINEDGACLKNDYVNSLFFDGNGRYTSGSAELDAYVADAIRKNTTEDMDQHEKLRTMYLYVRDNFTYYRRSAYATGKTNFAVEDATTMYATGLGNCYCYAAAFWAAARGLGYDAQAVSGTIGKEASPHGWVEILLDGERYVYDTEIEMAYRRDGLGERDMFEMPFANARGSWMYIEFKDKNAVAPRDNIQSFGNR